MEHKNQYLAIEGDAKNWEEAITLCGKAIAKAGFADESFMKACIEREKEYPTGLPSEVPVAIPHSKVDGIKENCVCFLRLKEPVTFQRMDSEEESVETKAIFNLAIRDGNQHLEFLQTLMQAVMNKEVVETCMTKELSEIPDYLQEKLG